MANSIPSKTPEKQAFLILWKAPSKIIEQKQKRVLQSDSAVATALDYL
jgi:hypothetical protein